jgi:hypothetical protein
MEKLKKNEINGSDWSVSCIIDPGQDGLYGLLTTQAATAARFRATGFVTNDPIFKRVEAFETLLFDELLCQMPTPIGGRRTDSRR